MAARDRAELWRELAQLTADQAAAAQHRDVQRFVSATVAMEACTRALKASPDHPATPLERVWARTVRRLSQTTQDVLAAMQQPWIELTAELTASRTGRAGPVTLDLRV